MVRILPFLIAIAMIGSPISARAERPPQKRALAPVALTGTVEAIDESWSLQTDFYRVSVRVENVQRGERIHPGELFVVSCFRRSRPLQQAPGAYGHKSIPSRGDKIALFAWPREPAKYEGNYPDWYDVVEPSPRHLLVRLFDSKKVRVITVTGACLSTFAAWRFWKKRTPIPRPVADDAA